MTSPLHAPKLTRSGTIRAGQTVTALLKLRQMILDGQLRAGERVPELSLVERTGISRTPIRTALLQLAEEGLLEPSSSGGFVVRAFDEQDVYDAIDLRGTLEGAAARRAAERGLSRNDLAEMRDCVGAMDAIAQRRKPTVDDFIDYVRLNEAFHRILIELANSAVLTRAVDRILALPFASPSAFVLAQAELPQAQRILSSAQQDHHGILAAIANGEPDKAESLTRAHSGLAKRNLEAATQREVQIERVAGGSLIRLRAVASTHSPRKRTAKSRSRRV